MNLPLNRYQDENVAQAIINITDSVANVIYQLDPETRTAYKTDRGARTAIFIASGRGTPDPTLFQVPAEYTIW